MSASAEGVGTPFLDVESFAARLPEQSAPEVETRGSPFLSVYEVGVSGMPSEPAADSYLTFLQELYDEEIDQALFELAEEAAAAYGQVAAQPMGDDPQFAQRVLDQHFAPMVDELEGMFGRLAAELESREGTGLGESEFESLLDGYEPSDRFTPGFEHLFGGLKKLAGKVASAARKGVGALAKLGLRKVLERLRSLVKPLLQKVLKAAVEKLPLALQPAARTLAQRLPFLRELPDEPVSQGDAGYDVTELQLAFDQQVADLVFAENEAALELEVAHAVAPPQPASATIGGFEKAQEEFIAELRALKEGEDPTPLVEGFLPALLPVIRMGFQLGGRKPVVDFLARLVGKLIGRFVGPQYAPALSKAIVDVGLRLMGLEVAADEERAAPAAVAATVVDTVRQVAALPAEVLDDPALLEAFALEAFEQAAAANLPPVLPDAVYRERPDLRPTGTVRGCWLPGRRYKKFSSTFATTLTPQQAEAVVTVGGATLADFLHEQLGVAPGDTVEADVHVYEAVPGTTLSELAATEAATVPGLAGGEQATAQLHPLTPDAAGLLLGEPRLGRPVSAKAMGSRRVLDLGQRMYHLAVPGRRPLLVQGAGGRAVIRRHSSVHVVVDFPAGTVTVRLFLGESRAQKLAIHLRQAGHAGTAAASLNAFLARGLRAALSGRVRGRVRLVHEALTPEQALGTGLRALAPAAGEALAGKLQTWLATALTGFFRDHGARFVTATEDTRDGVTVVCALRGVPGLGALREALKGGAGASMAPGTGTPSVTVTVVPGYDHG
ncbi:hypothetical protein [Streptomyces sp. NPDC093544]|uniref:hypothetical protein n=1 Tax=Streptomyces sp. NPDC093544 TaxID=3155200 RepID=UPI00341D05DF